MEFDFIWNAVAFISPLFKDMVPSSVHYSWLQSYDLFAGNAQWRERQAFHNIVYEKPQLDLFFFKFYASDIKGFLIYLFFP